MLDVPVHSLLRLCRSSVVFNTVLCVCLRWMRVRTCAQGGEDGEVCLWSGGKKKPIASAAHAVEQVAEEDHECSNWVSAVACCRYSDLAASGAADGVVRLWKADKSLTAVGEVPIEGHVNGLQLSAGWSLPPPYPPSIPRAFKRRFQTPRSRCWSARAHTHDVAGFCLCALDVQTDRCWWPRQAKSTVSDDGRVSRKRRMLSTWCESARVSRTRVTTTLTRKVTTRTTALTRLREMRTTKRRRTRVSKARVAMRWTKAMIDGCEVVSQ